MESTKKKLDEEAEQASAKDEPMGSVAAAVPRDAGSAESKGNDCPPGDAPEHKGGKATIVAGKESHEADKSGKKPQKPTGK
jgi:hypothetical protein